MNYINKLHSVNKGPGDTRVFCGPAVISAITGLPVRGKIRELINRRRGREGNKPVRGMHAGEVAAILANFGYEMVYVYGHSKKNLQTFVWEKYNSDTDKVYLINVTKHFVVSKGMVVLDNWEPDGCAVEDHPFKRSYIQNVWVVKKRD